MRIMNFLILLYLVSLIQISCKLLQMPKQGGNKRGFAVRKQRYGPTAQNLFGGINIPIGEQVYVHTRRSHHSFTE
jgi:hypothetical protein